MVRDSLVGATNGLARSCLLAAAVLAGCGGAGPASDPTARAAELAPGQPPSADGPPPFTDQAAELGLTFRHQNGARGRFLLPEIMGAGSALFDFDRDGDLDAYLVQGGDLDDYHKAESGSTASRDRLFRNELVETGELRFTDVTDGSGIVSTGYGMGVAVGDHDGDGLGDLYVTNLGPNRLWRNLGGGRFEDATAAAGVDDPRWSVSAAFLDYNGDDALDLFVVNYVDFNLGSHIPCTFGSGELDYCSPRTHQAEPDRLFRNLGDGRFEDVTHAAGLAGEFGNGLGVVQADLDLDGRPDLYVANDATPNQMWMNLGSGRFTNRALYGGSAVNGKGEAEAGMGVDAGDFDSDGDLDLYVTHITGETSTLYVNDGRGLFTDGGLAAGLDRPSLSMTGFGAGWFDMDNDGALDLLAVNGAVRRLDRARSGPETARRAAAATDHERRFGQPNQLFRNLGNGSFEEVRGAGGVAFEASEVSRGAAFGDVDNDGDMDVLVTNNGGPVRLLLNQVGQNAPWVGFLLRTRDGRPAAPGSLVEVRLAGGRHLVRTAGAARSYASSSDQRVLVGLGDGQIEHVVVRWPGGAEESFGALAPGSYHALQQGEGT